MKIFLKKVLHYYQLFGTKFINLLINRFYDMEYKHIYIELRNKSLLSPGNKEEIAKYKHVYKKLGCYVPLKPYIIFAPFLKKNRIEGWRVVPENIMANYISPILDPIGIRRYFSDKNVYDKLFPKEVLPKTILRRMEGIFFDESYLKIENLSDKELYDRILCFDKIIIKPTIDTSSGKGVRLFSRITSEIYRATDDSNEILSVDYLKKNYGDNFIIQECMKQSSFMAAFNKDSVNTFRIGSYLSVKDNNPKILFVGIRMGVKGSYVDNTHAGGAKIRVNSDGSLAKYAVEGFGNILTSYNEIDFEDNHLCVPNFSKIITLVKNLHSLIPQMRLIAFDIMLDSENKPKLIEYNIGGFSTWLPQWTGQCVLGEYQEEIIEYCAQNKNKALKFSYYIN